MQFAYLTLFMNLHFSYCNERPIFSGFKCVLPIAVSSHRRRLLDCCCSWTAMNCGRYDQRGAIFWLQQVLDILSSYLWTTMPCDDYRPIHRTHRPCTDTALLLLQTLPAWWHALLSPAASQTSFHSDSLKLSLWTIVTQKFWNFPQNWVFCPLRKLDTNRPNSCDVAEIWTETIGNKSQLQRETN